MAGRIRSIKPEWLENERLARCSSDARLLSVALICLADDHGNGRGSVEYLRAQVWAYPRDPRETLLKAQERVRDALAELEAAGYVVMYQSEGQSFFHIPGWPRHQKVNHVGLPRVPVPSDESLKSARDSLEPSRESLPGFSKALTRVTSNEKGVGSREAALRPMPAGWEPNESGMQKANELGLDVRFEADDFRNWTASKGQKYVNWDAGFLSHLTRQSKRRAKEAGHGPPANPLPIFGSSVGKPFTGGV